MSHVALNDNEIVILIHNHLLSADKDCTDSNGDNDGLNDTNENENEMDKS